jgi:D-serine deaminase-like pyridoxal phosphate-dependent protein
VEDLDGTDEIRPGNFVFYDLMQWQIGACDPDDIAVAVACPVVAKHPERQEIVLYGGAVHLSKDRIRLDDGNSCYGFATELTEDGWGNPIPDTFLKALSQEHGILKANGKFFEKTRVGDLIGILPVHSCLTADLLGGYLELKGKRIGAMTSKSFK